VEVRRSCGRLLLVASAKRGAGTTHRTADGE
jgi:hypothetical protein